jgi:hypothetical protein
MPKVRKLLSMRLGLADFIPIERDFVPRPVTNPAAVSLKQGLRFSFC